ncbi:hypothetical protein FEL34_11985 [Escherichia coli]|nr:hypothetical protein [Escherichia coli]
MRRHLNFPTIRRQLERSASPFWWNPFFPSAYGFVIYVCRHDSKNGKDGPVHIRHIYVAFQQ